MTRSFRCAAVLFDLDGVLIDSTRCVERHWRHWAAAHGLDADSILESAHGVRNVDTMRRIAPHLDVEREATLFAANEVADTQGVVAVDGAAALLQHLSGLRWAVVTSCSTELAHARLSAAGLAMPPLLITGSDVSRGKPDPEPYIVAADRLHCAPRDCVVVEDAPAGIEAGRRAGMRVVAVAFTYARQQLLLSAPDVAIDRITDMTIQRSSAEGIRITLP